MASQAIITIKISETPKISTETKTNIIIKTKTKIKNRNHKTVFHTLISDKTKAINKIKIIKRRIVKIN